MFLSNTVGDDGTQTHETFSSIVLLFPLIVGLFYTNELQKITVIREIAQLSSWAYF